MIIQAGKIPARAQAAPKTVGSFVAPARAGHPRKRGGRKASSAPSARRSLAHLPVARRQALRKKAAIFQRIAAEVARTGRKNIVLALCRAQSRRLSDLRGFSALRLYNDYYKWLRNDRNADALAKAIESKLSDEIARYLPHVVYQAVSDDGLPFARAFALAKKGGIPITGCYVSYLREARKRGYLVMIAEGRQLARQRRRLDHDHASASAAMAHRECRLLAQLDNTIQGTRR